MKLETEMKEERIAKSIVLDYVNRSNVKKFGEDATLYYDDDEIRIESYMIVMPDWKCIAYHKADPSRLFIVRYNNDSEKVFLRVFSQNDAESYDLEDPK